MYGGSMYQILSKRFRHRRRMKQKDLAKRSGVSISYISHLEADNSIRDRTPTLQVLENLALSLNVCPRDIVIYPCLECTMNNNCSKKSKDMRDSEEIANEILDYYV
jgi:transcriptional regulator with XRE-family HTH domain